MYGLKHQKEKRSMAVIMHRIWVDGTEFRWTRDIVAVWGACRINCDRRKLELHRAVEWCPSRDDG